MILGLLASVSSAVSPVSELTQAGNPVNQLAEPGR